MEVWLWASLQSLLDRSKNRRDLLIGLTFTQIGILSFTDYAEFLVMAWERVRACHRLDWL